MSDLKSMRLMPRSQTAYGDACANGWRRSRGICPAARVTLACALAITVLLGACASPASRPALPEPVADQVVVDKAVRRLRLYQRGRLLREYTIALGDNPIGDKQAEGDERTPEGRYILDWRNPNSRYYKAIHISYPDKYDTLTARLNGHSPGGMIMIHGLPNHATSAAERRDYLGRDWTDGCIALTNREMDEVWTLVPDGTPILIRP